MATPFSGKSGSLSTYNAGNATSNNVTNWSLTITDSAPGTAHSNSSGWVVSFLGVKSWSASIDVLQDSVAIATHPPQVGDTITTLVLDDGENTYSATDGVVSSAAYSCDIAGGGLVTVSLAVAGSGSIALATKP